MDLIDNPSFNEKSFYLPIEYLAPRLQPLVDYHYGEWFLVCVLRENEIERFPPVRYLRKWVVAEIFGNGSTILPYSQEEIYGFGE